RGLHAAHVVDAVDEEARSRTRLAVRSGPLEDRGRVLEARASLLERAHRRGERFEERAAVGRGLEPAERARQLRRRERLVEELGRGREERGGERRARAKRAECLRLWRLAQRAPREEERAERRER